MYLRQNVHKRQAFCRGSHKNKVFNLNYKHLKNKLTQGRNKNIGNEG